MTGLVVIPRWAIASVFVAWMLIAGSIAGVWVVNSRIHDQQARTDNVIADLCRNQKASRAFLFALATNQPNLDTRLLRAISESLNNLPERCP